MKQKAFLGDDKILSIEILQTGWTGLCTKISFKFFTKERLMFNLKFNDKLNQSDIPEPYLYLTSERNSYGILPYSWNFGVKTKLLANGAEQEFAISGTKRKFLNVTKTCSKYQADVCEQRIIENYNYSSCNEKCLALTVPLPKNLASKFKQNCNKVSDYKCMRLALNGAIFKAQSECVGHCTTYEFTSESTFFVRVDESTKRQRQWTMFFRGNGNHSYSVSLN